MKKLVSLAMLIAASPAFAGYSLYKPINNLSVTPPPSMGLSINKQGLVFEDTTENQVSVAQSVTLTNTGSLAVPYSGLSFAQYGADYTTTTTCGSSIPVGSSCSVSVQFTPKAAGTFNDVLTLNTGAGSYAVSVFGKGLTAFVPNLSVSQSETAHDFGSMWQGDTSTAYRFTLTNTGNVNATVGTPSGLTNFTYASTCVGATLTPNQSCSIDITAHPSATGLLIETLTVPTSAGNKAIEARATSVAQTYTYTLNGQSTLIVNAGNVLVGGSSTASSILITNTGNVTQSLSGFGLSGTNASEFSYSVGNCGASLSAGGSCTATATFSPTSTGTKSASLNFTMGPNVVSVSLTGTGTTINPIPPGATGFLLHMDGNYADAVSGSTPVVYGSPTSTTGKFTNSYLFNTNTTSALKYSNFTFGANDYSIEFFVRSIGSTDWRVIVGNGTSNTWSNGWMVYLSGGNKINMYVNNGGVGGYLFGSGPGNGPAIPANTWTHVAIVKNGTVCAMYINGTRVTTTNDAGGYNGGIALFNAAMAKTAPLWVGGDSTTGFVAGASIDELRIIKDGTPYNVNNTTITVPTAPYTP